MNDLWRRIEATLDARAARSDAARERRDSLRPPTDPASLARAEAMLGRSFPPELRAAFEVHDGQDPHALEVFSRWGLHSLADALGVWQSHEAMAREGLLDEAAWRREWLPVAKDGGGNHVVVDLRTGAVLEYRRVGPARPLSPSLRAWMDAVTSALPPEDDAEDDAT